ncbi:MAG: tyrosine-type recombinase/integrase [Mycobacteriaceae bacterium]
MSRRDFGNVRKLPSGRWQARYFDASGRRHQRTFPSRGDAGRFLAGVRADLDRGGWIDPRAGQVQLREYSRVWLENRRVRGHPLAPRTVERYGGVLRRHILPVLGDTELRHLTSAAVRAWYGRLTATDDLAPATAAKAYRLLHAICATAVADEQLARNPCSIPGASVEASSERPVATLGQVHALAEAIGPRYRALVLIATFCGLRFGELAGLTRRRLDLLHATVTVALDLDELDGGKLQPGRVKSEASRRVVAIPKVIVPDLEAHLAAFAEPGPDGSVFVGAKGGRLRRANFRKLWLHAVQLAGLDAGFRFHDLRHTGNTLAAATGASTKELMSRMGHASPRAALIYQHATSDRDTVVAAALSDLVEGAAQARAPVVSSLLTRGAGEQGG